MLQQRGIMARRQNQHTRYFSPHRRVIKRTSKSAMKWRIKQEQDEKKNFVEEENEDFKYKKERLHRSVNLGLLNLKECLNGKMMQEL